MRKRFCAIHILCNHNSVQICAIHILYDNYSVHFCAIVILPYSKSVQLCAIVILCNSGSVQVTLCEGFDAIKQVKCNFSSRFCSPGCAERLRFTRALNFCSSSDGFEGFLLDSFEGRTEVKAGMRGEGRL